jgi:hypothetical protein
MYKPSKLKFLAWPFLMVFWAAHLDAQMMMTIKGYRQQRMEALDKTKDAEVLAIFDFFIKGLGDGIRSANIQLDVNSRAKLFCTPAESNLQVKDYDQILESFYPFLTDFLKGTPIGSWRTVDEVPVGYALGLALRRKFPCSPSEKPRLDAQAMMTVKEYRETKATVAKAKEASLRLGLGPITPASAQFDFLIRGMGDGILWANLQLNVSSRGRLFCTPEALNLQAKDYQQMLDSFLPVLSDFFLKNPALGQWHNSDEVPVEFPLGTVLIRNFPCPPSEKLLK